MKNWNSVMLTGWGELITEKELFEIKNSKFVKEVKFIEEERDRQFLLKHYAITFECTNLGNEGKIRTICKIVKVKL